MTSSSLSRRPGIAAVAVALAVLLWAVYDAAGRLVPKYWFGGGSEQISAGEPAVAGPGRDIQYDVSRIVNAHIFGDSRESAEDDVAHAPETKLQLNLIGLISSGDDRFARALIGVNNARVKPYAIGQTIDGTDAAVHAVEKSRVLLKRGSALESLMLKRETVKLQRNVQSNQS